MIGMLTVMTLGAVALVVLAVVGVASAWVLARLMDRANQSHRASRFLRVLERIEEDSQAAALYYGLRWVGICILIGWLFSRAV